MHFRDALLKHRSYNYTPETTVVTTTLVKCEQIKRVSRLKIKPVYRDRHFWPTRLNLGKSWYFGMTVVTTSHIRIIQVLTKPFLTP